MRPQLVGSDGGSEGFRIGKVWTQIRAPTERGEEDNVGADNRVLWKFWRIYWVAFGSICLLSLSQEFLTWCHCDGGEYLLEEVISGWLRHTWDS